MVLYIFEYDDYAHDQYKCHSKDKIVWINRNNLQHIQQDNLLQNVQPHNFLNVTLNGQELQVLQTLQQFINNFKLEAYNMVNKTGVTHYGGALYVRTA